MIRKIYNHYYGKEMITLNSKWTNVLGVLGMVASIAATILTNVNQKNEITKAAEKAVEEALKK